MLAVSGTRYAEERSASSRRKKKDPVIHYAFTCWHKVAAASTRALLCSVYATLSRLQLPTPHGSAGTPHKVSFIRFQ